jgi:hypothetical protein
MDEPKQELGKVLDRDELATSEGPRALLRVEAPSDWLEAGGEVSVETPARLTCARCEGGGCDACNRSGALAAPSEIEARRIWATLPPESSAGVALRLVRPFGDDASIDQLILEVRPGAASRGLALVERSPLAAPTRAVASFGPKLALTAVFLAIAIAVALAVALR